MSHDPGEKAETQATARGLGTSIQRVDFVYFLKLYRQIFNYCTPIITVMQKPSLDAVQLRSMMDDFQRALADFKYAQVWDDALLADPDFPTVRARDGWRGGMEQRVDGRQESWKKNLETGEIGKSQIFTADQMAV